MHNKEIKRKIQKLNKKGEGYVDTIIKVLACVVIGALVLTGLYGIGVLGTNAAKEKVSSLFSYSPVENGGETPSGGGGVTTPPVNPSDTYVWKSEIKDEETGDLIQTAYCRDMDGDEIGETLELSGENGNMAILNAYSRKYDSNNNDVTEVYGGDNLLSSEITQLKLKDADLSNACISQDFESIDADNVRFEYSFSNCTINDFIFVNCSFGANSFDTCTFDNSVYLGSYEFQTVAFNSCTFEDLTYNGGVNSGEYLFQGCTINNLSIGSEIGTGWFYGGTINSEVYVSYAGPCAFYGATCSLIIDANATIGDGALGPTNTVTYQGTVAEFEALLNGMSCEATVTCDDGTYSPY